MLQLTEEEGACHGDDIGYMFCPNTPLIPLPRMDSKEFEMAKKLVSLVTSFAISGNPNSFESEVSWQPLTSTNPLTCLNISNDSMSVIPLPEQERMTVWEEIFRTASKQSVKLSNKM